MLLVLVNAIKIVPTTMEVMCVVVNLDTKFLQTTELAWVRVQHPMHSNTECLAFIVAVISFPKELLLCGMHS